MFRPPFTLVEQRRHNALSAEWLRLNSLFRADMSNVEAQTLFERSDRISSLLQHLEQRAWSRPLHSY